MLRSLIIKGVKANFNMLTLLSLNHISQTKILILKCFYLFKIGINSRLQKTWPFFFITGADIFSKQYWVLWQTSSCSNWPQHHCQHQSYLGRHHLDPDKTMTDPGGIKWCSEAKSGQSWPKIFIFIFVSIMFRILGSSVTD